jgi:signal transduction histidine kinase
MADGTWRWHLSQARFVADGPEGGARWYGTATDIHARKEAEQQLEEAVRLRDRIAATVAHDLRSPLGAIQLQLEVMRLRRAKGERSPHELDEALTRLERQVRSMRSTVDELVDVAQLQASGALALRPRETDLVALACTVAEDQRRSSERHRVEVRSEVHSLVGTWDAERLERVLTNLVSNAIKYSPEGGLVTIELEPASDAEGDAVVLRVSDEGLGIPASDRQRVFEWFARGTNVAGVDGSGVGLASVRRIVEQHGGRVDVESAEGRGTTFTVRLPLHAAAEPSPGGARVARSPADVGAARGAGVGARRPNR